MTRNRRLGLVIVMLLGLVMRPMSVVQAQTLTSGCYGAQQTFDVGGTPLAVAIADLNSDSKPDLVTADSGPDTVSVLLGNGDGTFQPRQTYSVGTDPASVAVADLDGDHKLDLVTADNGSNTVSVLVGNGDGTFQPLQSYSVGANPASVAIGDFNGDQKPDLVTADSGSNTVSVLLGNGNGTFQVAQSYLVGANPQTVVIGDLDNDGRPDLAVTNQVDNSVSVLLGNGDGTFHTQQTYAVDLGPVALAIAYVNGDGAPDLLTVNQTGQSVSVLLGIGTGAFQSHQDVAPGDAPQGVALGFVDGDGEVDIVTTVANPDAVSVLFGNGNGTFKPLRTFAVGSNPIAVAIADLNNDRQVDLVTANQGSDNVSVLLSACNKKPHVGVPAARSTMEDTSLNFGSQITVSDPDAGTGPLAVTLTVTHGSLALGSTANLTSLSGNGTATVTFKGPQADVTTALTNLIYTPTTNYYGPDAVTISVNDQGHNGPGGARTTTETVAITVTAVNDPPTISNIPDQGAGESTAIGPLSFTIDDAETAPSLLALTGSSNNQALVPNASITVGGSGGSRTVTVTPPAGQTGTAVITVTVADSQGLQASDTFTVNVGSAVGSGQVRLTGQTILSPTQPTAVWLTGAPIQATIVVPAAVQAPILDLTALLGACTSGTRSVVLPTALDVQRETASGTLTWSLPAPITITGLCSWDGKLKLPSLLDLEAPLPSGAPARTALTAIVDFGAGDAPLSFNKAYRLDLPANRANEAGLIRTGAYVAIGAPCPADTQAGANQLASNGLCRVNGAPVVRVWGKQSGLLVTSNSGCGPRPNVGTALASNGGALQVTISAARSGALAENSLRSVTFGAGANAQIQVPVQPGVATAQQGTGGFTVQLTGTVVDLTFTVRRVTAGQPTTVPITVVDGCGEWKTFVGGGASAGF